MGSRRIDGLLAAMAGDGARMPLKVVQGQMGENDSCVPDTLTEFKSPSKPSLRARISISASATSTTSAC